VSEQFVVYSLLYLLLLLFFNVESGAYIFRPNTTNAWSVNNNGTVKIVVFNGPVVSEVRQVWNNWVSQVVRLFNGADFVEFESTVGPITFDDDLGKEVITRFDTNLNTQQLWYTDSQGLEMQQRKFNYRPR
jgi:lysosomal alpha-mannosidase